MIDPLGGINTLWPLFGISNQMLAAIALTLVHRRDLQDEARALRLGHDRADGVAAALHADRGLQKIFHPDPSIGFLSHASRYSDALAQGQVLAPAKDAGQMSQIVFNDRIDAALAVLFVLVVVSILYYGIRACLEAYRADRWTAHETPARTPRRPRRSEARDDAERP